MVDPDVIFSVIIGGSLTLLGTLLANYLQYRSEKRELRKERTKERYAEVQRYLVACLQLADLISIPTTLGPEEFGPNETKEWLKLVSDHFDRWDSIPAGSSARVIFVEDKHTLQWLEQMDEIRMQFYINYRLLIKEGQMVGLDEKRKELQQLAAKVTTRLDQLLDRI